MGAADLVPGISGGTIAFIMGFYPDLLNSIKSFSFKNHAFKFLGSLICGILISFILLANFFDYILNNEVFRPYLYSGFLGLILASILLLLKEIKWKVNYVAALITGVFFAFIFTVLDFASITNSNHFYFYSLDLWLVFCGFCAVLALLLPGISGSYVLTILGSYPLVIGALADFTKNLKHMSFDGEAFSILASLAVGMIAGGAIFARVVVWLLKKYKEPTIALMSGFMIGALPAIWPFWTYSYFINPLKPEKGLRLKAELAVMPEFSLSFAICLCCLIVGFSVVFLIEYFANLKKQVRASPSLID